MSRDPIRDRVHGATFTAAAVGMGTCSAVRLGIDPVLPERLLISLEAGAVTAALAFAYVWYSEGRRAAIRDQTAAPADAPPAPLGGTVAAAILIPTAACALLGGVALSWVSEMLGQGGGMEPGEAGLEGFFVGAVLGGVVGLAIGAVAAGIVALSRAGRRDAD